jgi:lysophospholipase L1-like esterase
MHTMRLRPYREQPGWRKGVNLFGAVIAVFVVAEALLRIVGLAAGAGISRTPRGAQPDEALTILCIGDSWTAGQPDGNYPEALAEMLRQAFPQHPWQVVNLGRGGFNSSQGLRLLEQSLATYQPHIVIVMIGNNDHWNLTSSAYFEFQDERLSTIDILLAKTRIALHSVRVYRLARTAYWALTGRPTPNQFYYASANDEDAPYQTLAVVDRDLHRRQLQYNLLQYIEHAHRANFRLVLQTYFHFHGYDVNDIIAETAIRYQIPCVDNNTLFHQQIAVDDRPRYLIPDGHPNARGYAWIARNILDVLEDTGMLAEIALEARP